MCGCYTENSGFQMESPSVVSLIRLYPKFGHHMIKLEVVSGKPTGKNQDQEAMPQGKWLQELKVGKAGEKEAGQNGTHVFKTEEGLLWTSRGVPVLCGLFRTKLDQGSKVTEAEFLSRSVQASIPTSAAPPTQFFSSSA